MNMWGVKNRNKVKSKEVEVKTENIKEDKEKKQKHKSFDTSGGSGKVNEKKVSEDREEGTEDSGSIYKELTEYDMGNYKSMLIRLPGVASQRDRVRLSLEEGIPMEYLIDANIVTDKNLYEMDLGTEDLEYAYGYIKYKFPESSFNEREESKEIKVKNTESVDRNVGELREKTKATGEIKLGKEILDNKEPKVEEKEELEKVKEELVKAKAKEELEKEDYEKLKIYSQKEMDENNKENERVNEIKLKSAEGSNRVQINELNKTIEAKEEDIVRLNSQIKNLNETITGNISRMSELRKEIIGYKEKIKGVNEDIYNHP